MPDSLKSHSHKIIRWIKWNKFKFIWILLYLWTGISRLLSVLQIYYEIYCHTFLTRSQWKRSNGLFDAIKWQNIHYLVLTIIFKRTELRIKMTLKMRKIIHFETHIFISFQKTSLKKDHEKVCKCVAFFAVSIEFI